MPMRRFLPLLFVPAAALAVGGPVRAAEHAAPPTDRLNKTIADAVLADAAGRPARLFDAAGKSATVVVFLSFD